MALGDSLNFFLFAVPALAFCVVLNCYWAIKSFQAIRQRHDYRQLIGLALATLGWILIYVGRFHIS